MSYHLFLDDSRQPSKVTWVKLPENADWHIVKNYQEFVAALNVIGIPRFVSYDCDLCAEHYQAYNLMQERYVEMARFFHNKCGIDCIMTLIRRCRKLRIKHPPYQLHTMNDHAIDHMRKLIEDFNKGF